jgi:peptide/nickel transport system substrate-binding protein
MPDLAVPVPRSSTATLVKKNATTADPWGLPLARNNVAGGGAYKVESFKPGAGDRLHVRFDDWKSGPLPKLRRIVQRDVPNAGNRRALLVKGDIDITYDLPPKDFSELAAEGAAAQGGLGADRERHVLPRHERQQAALRQPKVRQAMAWRCPTTRCGTTPSTAAR